MAAIRSTSSASGLTCSFGVGVTPPTVSAVAVTVATPMAAIFFVR
jgi:hypothetical protein